MRLVRIVVAAALLAGLATPGLAQQPGEIFGKVTDTSGAVVPGVTVTLTAPVLLQPQVAVTGPTGSYRFPGLAVSTYTVKFEIPGFATFVRDKVRIEIGANVQINAALQISTVQETVTVSGETPVVDLRDNSKTSRFNQEALQSIPSARDPWVIIEQAAGVAMDRQNVGGSASGQQSNFVARGAAMREQKWNLDGVDITDMSATGGSPVYFDFDAFEEMQISAGRRRRDDAVARGGGEPRHQERDRQVPRLRPLVHHRPGVPVDQRHRRTAPAGRDHRQPDPADPGLRRRVRRPGQARQGVVLGQPTAGRTSTSASTTSTRTRRSARR